MENKKTPKEQFFSKISHDLRGSFTSILGFSDILNDPTEHLTNEEIGEFVKRIGIQTKESYDLLVNFINWLKLDSYSHGLTKESIDLSELVLNGLSLNSKKIAAKNIKIINHYDNSNFVDIDFEIVHSIYNNTFTYIISQVGEDSSIEINTVEADDKLAGVSFESHIRNNNLTFLNNIKVNTSNIPYPLLFASKICKLSGGQYNLTFSEKNELEITILLPKSINI